MSVVIAETRGTNHVSFYLNDDGTIEAWRTPVLAWRVDSSNVTYEVTAITIDRDADCGNGVHCLEMCTGVLVFQEDCSFRSFEEAEAYARTRLGAK